MEDSVRIEFPTLIVKVHDTTVIILGIRLDYPGFKSRIMLFAFHFYYGWNDRIVAQEKTT